LTVVDDPAPGPAPTAPDAAAPTAAGGDPAAELSAVTVTAGGRTLLAPVDLTVARGETVAVVGRSGVGKTTLLHVLAGLLTPSAGTVRADPAALMPQRDGLMPWATAADNAALPLRIAGTGRREARAAATAQLATLGLAEHARRRVARLSGGQRQRVALARTLLTGRELLLLDEPFAAVDALTRDDLHALLLEHLGTQARAAVLVTHDVDEAVRLGDRLLVLTTHGLRAPSLALTGTPGERLSARGGEPLRAAILAELAA
jgi:NitT/TauT family transport system ATP-binding protein